MTRRAFWFHYNKPMSRKVGRPQLTIHWQGACHVVDSIECCVSTKSRVRKSQPHVVIAGRATGISFNNGHALIY